MSIEIHPEAAKRLDELANQLLTKVVPEPPLMPAKERFRPDIYPVAHIPEQDIIGELVEIRSVVDGSGQEVGRFFQQDNPRVGLVGEGFRALIDLAWKFQKLEALRETTSFGFILDTVFEWVEGKYINTRPERLTEYVRKRTEEEIKDFEIWFPLHRTYLESSFPMGPIVFRTITREMMDKCEARVPKPDPETAKAFQLAFARDRSAVQGCAAAATKIRAERSKAMETPGSRLRARWRCCVFSPQRTGRLG